MMGLVEKREKQNSRAIHISVGILSGMGCVLMVLFPAMTLESAKRGIQLWASCVLPALLPFFICANFMIALGVPGVFGRCFEKLFQRLFRVPGIAAFVFFMSITSGYPMGAKLIGDLTREQVISTDDAKRMIAFCTTTGPLFILGAVGSNMLHSALLGVAIAVSHYGGAILNGILFGLVEKKQVYCIKNNSMGKSSIYNKLGSPKNGTVSFLTAFTDSIISSIRTLGVICGYLVMFCLLIDFLQASTILDAINSPIHQGLIKGVIEMTLGCNEIAALSSVSTAMICAACSFLISFGGCSVLFQSMSMLNGTGITIKQYAGRKLCHGILAGGIAYAIVSIIKPTACTVGAFPQSGVIALQLSSAYRFFFSIKMIVLTCIVMALLIFFNEWWIGRKKSASAKDE